MAHIYGLDQAGEELAKAAKNVADGVLAKHADDVDRKSRYPEESIRALTDAGLMGLCLPAALGGRAQPPRTFVAVVEELAQRCSSTAMIYVMHVSGSMALANSVSPDRDAVLKEIAQGKHLTTLALSEKGSRSMFWMPVSKLEKNGEAYVTNAFKSWVTSASRADSYVSSAQRPGAAGPLESTLYLLKNKTSSTRVAAPFDGLGLRGNDSAPVSIEGYEVKENDLLTAHGGGLKMMLEVVLPWFAAGTAAMSNGLCRAAITATQTHLVGTTFETGGALRDFANLRARLADMHARTEQSRALLGYTVKEMEAPNDVTPLYVLSSRLAALEAATIVTDTAMKTCGGAAYSRHLGLERVFRDANAGWVMAPTVDHLRDFIGKALTSLPLL
jgi:alkylation response protein AidB-like acyl-CoA dehydrogenase